MFLSFFALLILGVTAIALNALFYERPSAIADVTNVSRLPGVAFSVPYYEPRVREYRDDSDRFYPTMQPINSMDFIYAR